MRTKSRLTAKAEAKKLERKRMNRLRWRAVHKQLIEAELDRPRTFDFATGGPHPIRFDPTLLKELT